ncbi:hypothetical protein JQ615_01055 [Bradyrhizobium jicamae]|uniref:Integrase n=1 Tax=Bradyrhizobium jicamae TaxID=280332 RepID=A0ABS5FB07_9BRAD|nr:hypothetical protein [Bradyrhizobium jicamae]MBR0793969.1 hypothetical protein [Bradyrhizobium jicamae]
MNMDSITVTSVDAFEDALLKFEAGGSRRECMESLLALGMPAGAIRWLSEYPGRTMTVCERA